MFSLCKAAGTWGGRTTPFFPPTNTISSRSHLQPWTRTYGYISLFLVQKKFGSLNDLFPAMPPIYPNSADTVKMHSHRRYRVMAPNFFFSVRRCCGIEVYLYKDWPVFFYVIGRKNDKLKLIFMSSFDGCQRSQYVSFLLFHSLCLALSHNLAQEAAASAGSFYSQTATCSTNVTVLQHPQLYSQQSPVTQPLFYARLFSPFCFNTSYQFTTILNFSSFVFGVTPNGVLPSITPTSSFWWEYRVWFAHFCWPRVCRQATGAWNKGWVCT